MNWETKIEENEYTYEMYVGYKKEMTPLGYEVDSYEVAYIAISKVKNSLESIKVAPEFQGKGIANQLMAIAKGLGIDNLLAEANGTGLTQESLIAFYEKHDFKKVVSDGNSTYMVL